jgi:hypothetical protein
VGGSGGTPYGESAPAGKDAEEILHPGTFSGKFGLPSQRIPFTPPAEEFDRIVPFAGFSYFYAVRLIPEFRVQPQEYCAPCIDPLGIKKEGEQIYYRQNTD